MYEIHKYFGEFIQLVPIVIVVWYAIKKDIPFQRYAPILLDINVLLGALLYFVNKIPVPIAHPILMVLALIVAHAVAKNPNKNVVIGAWIVVLILVVSGVMVVRQARGG